MTRRSIREYLAAQRARYAQADRATRHTLLDEMVAATGYHRKAVIRHLRQSRPPSPGVRPVGRPRRYGPPVAAAASVLWEAAGQIGAKFPTIRSRASGRPRARLVLSGRTMPPRRAALPRYWPRRPADSALHQVIGAHLETFLTGTAGDAECSGLPVFIKREFEATCDVGSWLTASRGSAASCAASAERSGK